MRHEVRGMMHEALKASAQGGHFVLLGCMSLDTLCWQGLLGRGNWSKTLSQALDTLRGGSRWTDTHLFASPFSLGAQERMSDHHFQGRTERPIFKTCSRTRTRRIMPPPAAAPKTAMTESTDTTADATPTITIASTPHESWGVLGEEHMKRASDKHLRTAPLRYNYGQGAEASVSRNEPYARRGRTMDDLLASLFMRLVAEAARLAEMQMSTSFVPPDLRRYYSDNRERLSSPELCSPVLASRSAGRADQQPRSRRRSCSLWTRRASWRGPHATRCVPSPRARARRLAVGRVRYGGAAAVAAHRAAHAEGKDQSAWEAAYAAWTSRHMQSAVQSPGRGQARSGRQHPCGL